MRERMRVGLTAGIALLLSVVIWVSGGGPSAVAVPSWLWTFTSWVSTALLIFGSCLIALLISGNFSWSRGSPPKLLRNTAIALLAVGVATTAITAAAAGLISSVPFAVVLASLSLFLQVTGATMLAMSMRTSRHSNLSSTTEA